MVNKSNYIGGLFLLHSVSPESVFTPEDFSAEQKDIRQAVDDFVDGEISSRPEQIEHLDVALSRSLMAKAGELGILGIDIPEAYGGMGLDKICSAIVSERFGYGAGSFTITEINHTGIGTLPVALFGTEEQKRRYLPKLIRGDHIGAFGLTEPEAGSDALNPLTSARLSDDGATYILNGSKQFITNAGFSDLVFVYAKVNDEHFTAFIVEQNWEGVSVDDEEDKMGMHGTSTRAYSFNNVHIPIENVLGEIGKGHLVALNALNMGRFKVGAVCIGSSKRAFYEAVKYSKQRKQFGKSICEFGLIKSKIANMAIRIYAAESMMYRTAGLIQNYLDGFDDGIDHTADVLAEYLMECSINKVYGSETEDFVVDEELQIFGGYGYIKGHHPETAYRNARINRIWEGTNEINRLVIANTFLKKMSHVDWPSAFATTTDLEIPGTDIVDDHLFGLLQQDIQTYRDLKNISCQSIHLVAEEYGKQIKEEQEILGMISDLIMLNYALESSLLRVLKSILKSKNRGLLVHLISSLTHECMFQITKISSMLIQCDTNDSTSIEKAILSIIDRRFRRSVSIVQSNRNISDAMIKIGRYRID